MKNINIGFLLLVLTISLNAQGAREYFNRVAEYPKHNWSGGNKYYLSWSDGNDSNDGLTPQTAWKSLDKINKNDGTLSPKDTVLLKCGDIWTASNTTLWKHTGSYAGLVMWDVYDDSLTFDCYGDLNDGLPKIDGQGRAKPFQHYPYGTGVSGHQPVMVKDITFRRINFFNSFDQYDQNGNYSIGRCAEFWAMENTVIDSCIFDGNFSAYQCVWFGGGDDAENASFTNSTFKNGGLTEGHGIYGNFKNGIFDGNVFLHINEVGIKAYYSDNMIVRYNWFEDITNAAIYNGGNSGTDVGNQNVFIHHNVMIGNDDINKSSVFWRSQAGTNARIENNTMYQQTTGGQERVSNWWTNHGPGNIGINLTWKKNIVYMPIQGSGSGNSWYMLMNSEATANLPTMDLDSNVYYGYTSGNSSLMHRFATSSGSSTTIEGWRNLTGKEANSLFSDPMFVDAENLDFRLQEGSPAISLNAGAFEYETSVPDVKVSAKVFLGGCYHNSLMSTELNSKGLIPSVQPYNVSPWNYSGVESVSSIPENIVDWVLIELRSSVSTLVAQKAALLNSSGYVVDLDGTSPVTFSNISAGDYYVVVKHRSHLGVMSSTKISLSSNEVTYDFTDAQLKAYGTNAMENFGDGNFGLCAGDGDANGTINDSDYEPTASNIFNQGYFLGDLDMNGIVNVLDYTKVFKCYLKSSNVPVL